jgi:hypothetical protein
MLPPYFICSCNVIKPAMYTLFFSSNNGASFVCPRIALRISLFRRKPVAHAFVAPALCKLRKGRGTRGPVSAAIKSRDTRARQSSKL